MEQQKKNEDTNQATMGIEKLDLNDVENSNRESPVTIYGQFQATTILDGRFCEKNFSQKATHFSQLPIEVIMLILKWVVSDSLDVRSLEKFSSVCKGFYVCARDPDIWRLVCAKIWGQSNINNYLTSYSNWRNMFLTRPHLNYDGIYISKTSYARAGEKSLDMYYAPWHLVEYYRYLRFFSDGTVLFLTTPEEPKITVSKLKNRSINLNSNPLNMYYNSFHLNEHSILKGSWNLALSKVQIVLYKRIRNKTINKYSRRQAKEPQIEQEHIFRLVILFLIKK